MKRPDAIEMIEFPLGRIMEYTQKILVAFAIAFLGSLSLSSAAYIRKDFDITKNFEKNFELPRILREKRQSEHVDLSLAENKEDFIAEDLSEKVHDRRAIAEEIQESSLKYDKLEEREKQNAHEGNSDTEEKNTQDEAVSYKKVQNVIHALLYDNEDLAEKLSESRENSTDSDGKLLKRHLHYGHLGLPVVASNILGADFLEEIPLERLDGHSCEVEAFNYGHSHHSGLLTHEFFCELRIFHHYLLYSLRNLKSEFTLGPLVTEEVIEGDVLGSFYRHTPQLLETIIKEPHHLSILPEIIRDVVPFHSIFRAIYRIGSAFFKVLHFVRDLYRLHLPHVLKRFFLHHHLGLHLLRILHHFGKLYLLDFLGLIIPEHIFEERISSPVVTCDEDLDVPEYHHSSQELISSFRGFYDGYFSSGIHDLFKSGLRTFNSVSTRSTITSFVSTIPFLNRFVSLNIIPFLNSITTISATGLPSIDVNPVIEPIFENFAPTVAPIIDSVGSVIGPFAGPLAGLGSVVAPVLPVETEIVSPLVPAAPVETETVSTAVSSASSASSIGVSNPIAGPVVGGPVISPLSYGSLVSPIAPAYPAATETVTSSAASAASSSVVGTSRPVPRGPLIAPFSYDSLVSPVAPAYPAATETVTSSAASAASLSAVGASRPIIGGPLIAPFSYDSLVRPVAPAYPTATETVTSSVSSAASASSIAGASSPILSPVIEGPIIEGPVIGGPVIRGPVIEGPVINPVAPAYPVAAETASSSAASSASTTTTVVEAQPVVAVNPVVHYTAPAASVIPYSPVYSSSPAVSLSETTVSSSSSSSVSVAESEPLVEAVPEIVDCVSGPVVSPAVSEVESTVTTTASASAAASTSSVSDVAAVPFSRGPLGVLSQPILAPVAATSASASSSATVSTTDHQVEPIPFVGYNYPRFPLARPAYYSSLTPSPALASAMAAAISGAVSTTSNVISRRDFSFVLPREKIVGVLGTDCMLPGDIVSVTLKNKTILYGNVLDAASPIRFSFTKPRLYSLLRKSARVWTIQHSDFTDPECLDIFNDPVLLRTY